MRPAAQRRPFVFGHLGPGSWNIRTRVTEREISRYMFVWQARRVVQSLNVSPSPKGRAVLSALPSLYTSEKENEK